MLNVTPSVWKQDGNTKSVSFNNNDPPDISPRVACFFMVDKASIEKAISVRYSLWGKRCHEFVIIANGVSRHGEHRLDNNTILVDIHYVIQTELQAFGWEIYDGNKTTGDHSLIPDYASFPEPDDERKVHLTLKSLYSWLFMSRRYFASTSNGMDTTKVDYIMKVDPDTYMIMDNYLAYLSHYYTPDQHAFIGRVFKTWNNYRDPFVTGLSVTLSRATATLLLFSASVEGEDKECSLQTFGDMTRYGEMEDYVLSQCLGSLGVYPSFTRDDKNRERFMHFSPDHHNGDSEEPEWYKAFTFTTSSPNSGCCSSDACAFHYVSLDRQNDTLVYDETLGSWHWETNTALRGVSAR